MSSRPEGRSSLSSFTYSALHLGNICLILMQALAGSAAFNKVFDSIDVCHDRVKPPTVDTTALFCSIIGWLWTYSPVQDVCISFPGSYNYPFINLSLQSKLLPDLFAPLLFSSVSHSSTQLQALSQFVSWLRSVISCSYLSAQSLSRSLLQEPSCVFCHICSPYLCTSLCITQVEHCCRITLAQYFFSLSFFPDNSVLIPLVNTGTCGWDE